MGDVGIGLLLPQYDQSMLTAADASYWEVLYDDGTVARETEGVTYAQIDRARLASFRIVHAGEILIDAYPPPGASGYNLVYRRRTALTAESGARHVLFVFGYVPMGPVFGLDVDANAYRVLDAFDPADPQMYPPVPMPGDFGFGA